MKITRERDSAGARVSGGSLDSEPSQVRCDRLGRSGHRFPADLVVRAPEAVAGYPDRILPRDEAAAKELKKRTLTNLYNARPQWLANAHAGLDEAVAEACRASIGAPDC